jgi:hypothetical protein
MPGVVSGLGRGSGGAAGAVRRGAAYITWAHSAVKASRTAPNRTYFMRPVADLQSRLRSATGSRSESWA